MSKIIEVLKELLEGKRPVTVAGAIVLVLAAVGVNITPEEAGGAVAAVGGVAAFIEKYVTKAPLLK